METSLLIMGIVKNALKKAGHRDLVDQFLKEMMSAKDYDHALRIVMEYVEVE